MWEEFFEANRDNWNDRAGIHARSRTYDLEAFRADPEHLSGVVRFDAETLGDLSGLKVVHLQCHIGTDTLSLARLGAEVTGVDLSDHSIEVARELFESTGTPGRFVSANVYDALEAVGGDFDLVYTGVGSLCWLPNIERWGGVVASLLRPGGRLHIRDAHPMANSVDDSQTERLTLRFPYFEVAEPLVWDEPFTYTDGEDELVATRSYEWNHGVGEIVMSLIDRGMRIDFLREHREIDWQPFERMVQAGNKWVLPDDQRDLLPLMFSLGATRLG